MNHYPKYIAIVTICLFILSCQNQKKSNSSAEVATTKVAEVIIDTEKEKAVKTNDSSSYKEDTSEITEKPIGESDKNAEAPVITDELLKLEAEYAEMLQPIVGYKESDSKMYWFMVSWLKTNYKTPDWTGYDGSDTWRLQAKKKGIDCSGFARIMQNEIFDMKIAGGSQGLLNNYCNRIASDKLEMGDLVFFRAPYSKSDRIVHVGVYLEDNNFVHATSTKSAAIGLGLKIDSLEDERWGKELVTAGRVKSEFSK